MARWNYVALAFALLAQAVTAQFGSGSLSDCEDDTCVPTFAKCGGTGFNVSVPCCDSDSSCVVKNYFYAQCRPSAETLDLTVWDGTVITCEEMPDVMVPPPPPPPMPIAIDFKILDPSCEDDACVFAFEQCGGAGFNTSVQCCEEGTECFVKNYQYAQCVTPERAALNVADHGWDGRSIVCEEMPVELAPDPAFSTPAYMFARSLIESDCEDDSCVATFEKCGGKDFNASVSCCNPLDSCVVKNVYYAQCLSEERAAMKVGEEGWDGRTLMCDEMPEDLMEEISMFTPGRRLEQASTDCENDDCVGTFDKCGGNGFNVSVMCCDPLDECVMKNKYYSQCLKEDRKLRNIAEQAWDGEVLECADMDADIAMRGLKASMDCESDICVEEFEKCGGAPEFNVSVMCCDPETTCVKKNMFYAQCLTTELKDINVEMWGWDGEELQCAEMSMPEMEEPEETEAPMSVSFRRLTDAGSYGYGDYGSDAYGSDAYGGYGSYGGNGGYGLYGDFGFSADGDGGECNGECASTFEKCAGYDMLSKCCGDGTDCYSKNPFYAQCLTPERAARNVENFGWDGMVVTCTSPSRKLLDASSSITALETGFSRNLLDYGSYGVYGSYGSYGVLPEFYECTSNPCCVEGTFCTSKDSYYAQCLSPARAEVNKAIEYWSGDILPCPATSRRSLLDSGTYGCDTCVDIFDKCSPGEDRERDVVGGPVKCCAEGSCVMKNEFYAQCLTEESREEAMQLFAWDGAILECGEEMPTGSRRLQQVDRNVNPCDDCMVEFDQCGGQDMATACCAVGACYKKNDLYAQCLTAERAQRNIDEADWDGSILECGQPML